MWSRVQGGVKRTRKYFKVNKIARARWAGAICSLYLHQIAREIMFFPISNIPLRKHHSGSRLTEFCKLARANCNLHSCSNFALVLHEIAFLFSQSLEVELLNSLPILFPWSYFLTHFVTSTCVCFFFFQNLVDLAGSERASQTGAFG